MRTALVMIALAAAPVAAEAQGLEGKWSQAGSAGCGAGTEGGLEVARDGFVLGETHCPFPKAPPAGFTAVSGPLTCLVEGTQAVEAHVALRLQGETATLSFDNAEPMRFARCGG